LPLSLDRERVLGDGNGPGLVFRTPTRSINNVSDDHVNGTEDQVAPPSVSSGTDPVIKHSTAFLPISLAKGKPSILVEEGRTAPRRTAGPLGNTPGIDFFSLGLSLWFAV